VPDDELERRDYEALLATRRELGPDYETALVESCAERVQRAVEARSQSESLTVRQDRDDERGDRQRQLALGIVSLGVSIPITIPLAVTDHLPALVVSWAGIVAVNFAHASVVNARHRRHRR
jgi:hypothetical protein